MLRTEELRKRIKFVEEYLMEDYKQKHPKKERDWRTQEQRIAYEIKGAIRNIEPLVEEAVSAIKVSREKGRTPELALKQKVILLLLKELFDRSNRTMTYMLDVFSLLSGIDVSYKTVERLYSDPEVELALHNLHVLMLKKKGVRLSDASGDGTGYSLTIKKNYADECTKRKDKAKDGKKSRDKKGRRLFAYSFKILDIKTWLYVAYGMSLKSEKDAFDKASLMLSESGVLLGTVRLDKYFSSPSFVDSLKGTKVYVLPKTNASVRGSLKWKRSMEEYFKRENSESAFAQDKRWTGWKVDQRREDRINTAIACSNLWHNMFNMHRI